MRVLHVDLGSPATGADGISVAITNLGAPLAAFDVESTTLRTPRDSLRQSFRDAEAARRRVIDESVDIVHLHSVFRPAHLRLAAALGRSRIPYLISPHSGLAAPALRRQVARKRCWIALFERRYLVAAARVVCLSDIEAADVRRIEARARTVVVPNALDRDVETPAWSPSEPPRVVTLARYDVRQKGLDRLVALARHCPDVSFAVYGERDGNDGARIERLLRDLPDNVRFHPMLRGEKKGAVLAGAAAYLAPSRWEGVSMSMLEALHAGVPCVASAYAAATLGVAAQDVIAIPDEILDHQPSEAARRLMATIGDRDGLAALAVRGRVAVEQMFGPAVVGRRLAGIYQEILESRCRSLPTE